MAKTYNFNGLTLNQAEAEVVEKGIKDDDLVVYIKRDDKSMEVKLRRTEGKHGNTKIVRFPFKGPGLYI